MWQSPVQSRALIAFVASPFRVEVTLLSVIDIRTFITLVVALLDANIAIASTSSFIIIIIIIITFIIIIIVR